MLAKDSADRMIPGLDNGYVVEIESDTNISIRVGSSYSDYPHVVPRGYVCVTLNDAEGNEFYLICPGDMPVTTDREV